MSITTKARVAPFLVVLPLLLFFLVITHPITAKAARLTYVSDVISSSNPGATSTHSIQFTAPNAVPPNGRIVVRFDGAISVPAALDYTDVDFATAVATTGPFVDRTLAAVASVVEDGVVVVPGMGGTVTINLSSGVGINASDTVQIEIGDNATFDAIGDQHIILPPITGYYRVNFETYDAGGTMIDSWGTILAIVAPVGIAARVRFQPVPTRFNGLPTGLLPDTTANVWLSFNTDVAALCKYATSSGIGFFDMSSSTFFTTANLSTLHYETVSSLPNTIYSYYVRCMNLQMVPNLDDYLIRFEIGSPPGTTTPPLPSPPPLPGLTPPAASGPSGGGGGGGGLFLTGGDVTLEGIAAPFSHIVIVKDGVIEKEDQVSVLGDFHYKFERIQRGTYTWGVYVRDPGGNNSSTYNSTIYLIARTNNIIAPIYVSPTIGVATTTVPLGDPILLHGYAIALKPVQVIMNRQGDFLYSKIITATTTANGDGSWALSLPTTELAKATYELKAQTLISRSEQSINSPTIYVGVGENPNPNFGNRSDLNKDGKVNLVDFSILLFNWKTSDPVADINMDGTVNLTDFSIMLSNWTG